LKQTPVCRKAGEVQDSDLEDDGEEDYVPITDEGERGAYSPKDDDASLGLIALHCKTFMERAFTAHDESKTYNNTQQRIGSMTTCRTQEELD